MKIRAPFRLTGLLLLIAFLSAPAALPAADWRKVYDSLLEKYVNDGKVRYAAWHANPADRGNLGAVALAVQQTDPQGMSRDEQLAFYLNAYNVWALKTVLDHYPVESIKDTMFLVFKRDIITVAGEKMSFSELEDDIIRGQFGDPRIHFALNCASTSCPPLHGDLFEARSLDDTLTRLTRDFIARNPAGVRQGGDGGTAYISKIFDWYEKDFEKAAGSVAAFLNRYLTEPLPPDVRIRFQNYDWSLNKAVEDG